MIDWDSIFPRWNTPPSVINDRARRAMETGMAKWNYDNASPMTTEEVEAWIERLKEYSDPTVRAEELLTLLAQTNNVGIPGNSRLVTQMFREMHVRLTALEDELREIKRREP